ncbi:MAG: diguanylate cyclase [Campylobacterota bacterium]|nr:diguanylate cyclase [Campylobacterota bacterium]
MNKAILKEVNILYVEDEQGVRELTSSILSKFVNILVEAVDGQNGLELFIKHNQEENDLKPFHVVVTDISMPNMDGLEMIGRINEIDSSIPTIITTAHNDSGFLKKAINQRVRGYVNKPLKLNELIDAIVLAVEPSFLKDKLIESNKNLEAQVEEKTLELRSIIDSQENLILVMNNNEVSTVNKTLLDFFGSADIDNFKTQYGNVNKAFLPSERYFSSINDNWIEEIEKLESMKKIVKMNSAEGEERIFQVNITSFFYNTEHYVVSFTDITELKNYTYKLQYQATHDNLTKLFNRKKLNDELVKEIQRENRYHHGFSLIMFDIDNFKSINDTYGHDVGDVVLQEVSQITRSSVRTTDIAARWGGEEFMIIVPETSMDNAVLTADNIRKNIESFQFDSLPKPVTVSLGVAEFKRDVDNKESILKKVDIALYEAKHSGKNVVVKYEK